MSTENNQINSVTLLHQNRKGVFAKYRSQVRVKFNINMAFRLTLLVAFCAGVFPLPSGATDFKALVEPLEKLNVEMNALSREMIETRTACDRLHDESMVGEPQLSIIGQIST